MHIALVMDPERQALDGPAVERLAVALAADGAQVTRILPATPDDVPATRLIPVRTYDYAGSALFRRSRLGSLSSDMEDSRPDAFVAFGARALGAAAELAEDLEAALIAMIATEDELARSPLRRVAPLIDLVGVSTAPLVARASRWISPELVQLMPLGVAVPSRPPPAAPQSVAIAGTARDVGAYRAVYAALADAAPALPDLQVAIEFPPGHDPKLWGLARQHGIQHILNGVQRLEQVRPLALACEVLVLPEPVRGTRSLVLEAMACGRTVVTIEDAVAHFLIDGVTALVARDRDPREWTRLMARALLEGATTAPLRAEAAVRMASQFSSARCAAALLEACTTAVRGPLLPFR